MAAVARSSRFHADVDVKSLHIKHDFDRRDSLEPYGYGQVESEDCKPVKTECPMSDDWLDHALAKLQSDTKVHLAMELAEKPKKSQPPTKAPRSKVGRKSSSTKAKSRDAPRPPLSGLAASHPSLYNKSTAPVSQYTALKAARPAVTHASCPEASYSPMSEPSIPPWQAYVDPKRLAGSGCPELYDASPRMLKIDTRTRQTNVVSPLFMIPMPCGGLVEMAHSYDLPPRDEC